MHKIIVLGDRDSIYGFSAGGFETCFMTEQDDVVAKIRQLAHADYAVIYIVEKLYLAVKEHLREYDEALSPAIIPIPGAGVKSGVGLENIQKMVERAIGSDILFGSSSSS